MALVSAVLLSGCGGAAPAASSPPPAASKPAAAPASAAAASPSPASSAPAGAGPAAPGGKEKITVAYTSATMDQLSAMVAKERGFFDQNGLDADVVAIGSGSNPSAAVLSGQVVAYAGGPEIVAADINGADLAYIAAASVDFNFWLYTIPSITTAEQLKGKQVAVTSLGSSTQTAAKIALRSLNLDPEKDVVWSAVNNPPAILAALQNGAVQAGSIGSSNITAVRQTNMHLMVDVSKLDAPYPAGWHIVSRKYAAAHEDQIQRYMKSIVQAIAYMSQQPDGTKQVLSKYSKSTDQTFLDANYQLVAPKLQRVPLVPLKGVQLVIDETALSLPQAKGADPATFVDDRYVKSLDASGFIAGLYK
jgi:NitT/TauT family transport system substrate-binding protein